MARIALSEMIEELRKELQIAVKAGEGEDIRFGVGELTLEVEVEMSKAGSASGGVKFWVAELGVEGEVSKTKTQKIVLTLKPPEDLLLSR
jgi:translation elongation factor EF-1beta